MITGVAKTAFETALAERAATLSPVRAAAFAGFKGAPHRRLEAWKWTDMRAALREPLPEAGGDGVIAPSIFANAGPFEITVMNGRSEMADAPADARITIDEGGAIPALAEDHALAPLATAFAREELVIDIMGPVAPPILIRRIAGAGAVHHRARIRFAAGASATIIESHDGAGSYFANSLTDYEVGAGAKLTRVVLQNAADAGVEASLAAVRLAAGARLEMTTLAFGAKLARLETHIAVEGAGACIHARSAAALSDARHADVTSLVRFEAEGCEARQTHRAALKDRARGVFQGKFYVARGARKTDAHMNAGALLLSDEAEANHKPELEIYADDVQCAHGATSGALDADAIFYMRQRGLDGALARMLLIDAFLAAAFDHDLHAGLEHILRGRVSRWLEAK
jgi:Fe-S cluster assembly protein SufD